MTEDDISLELIKKCSDDRHKMGKLECNCWLVNMLELILSVVRDNADLQGRVDELEDQVKYLEDSIIMIVNPGY
jgi:hypothetical protein